MAVSVTAIALDYACAKQGILKIGEIQPGQMEASPTSEPENQKYQMRFIPPWLYDALEVTLSPRGIGWEFGRGVHIPIQTRPLERPLFLRATLLSSLLHFLLLDFIESLLKFFPGVGTPQGGSIFYPHLPPLQRYTVSTIIHLLTGTALISGFTMVYDLFTLFAVTLLDSPPAAWPPVMDNPWSSDSLHVFWAKRWHQFLRRILMVCGGYLGKWLLGSFGMIQGIFLASGLYHECAMYTMGRGWDNRVVVFFVIQAPLLACEKLWSKSTGRKVGGLFGRLWVYFVIFVLAQPMSTILFLLTTSRSLH